METLKWNLKVSFIISGILTLSMTAVNLLGYFSGGSIIGVRVPACDAFITKMLGLTVIEFCPETDINSYTGPSYKLSFSPLDLVIGFAVLSAAVFIILTVINRPSCGRKGK